MDFLNKIDKMIVLVCVVIVCLYSGANGSLVDQMAETTQLCCNKGSSFARNHSSEECSSSLPPEVPAFASAMCVFVMDRCCKDYYQKKKDCDTGMVLGVTSKNCEATSSTETMKSCCEKCLEGQEAGRSRGEGWCAQRVSGQNAEELLGVDAFNQCCLKASKVSSTSESRPRATQPADPVAPSKAAIVASVCEEYAPNELCAHHCIPVPGSYRCECNPGFTLMSDGRNCKEMTKNRCKPHNPCQHKCYDTGTDIKCSCKKGYKLMADGKSCEDINECQLNTAVCRANTECHNVPGSYKCIPVKVHKSSNNVEHGMCPPGYARNVENNACDDINECLLPNPPCAAYLCENTLGGYKCGGLTGDPANLSPAGAPREDRCPPGFRAGGSEECVDVDECIEGSNDCNPRSQFCINTRGSFHCQDQGSRHCPPGFKIGSRGKCEDINECTEGQDVCKINQVCVNVPGEYDCRPADDAVSRMRMCPDGMRLIPGTGTCQDINECVEGTHLCDQYQSCLNTNGSHECRCKLGYHLDPTTGACEDINECATGQHNCIPVSQRCDNTVGSFLCVRIISCGEGYILHHSKSICEDIDECALGTDNCARAGHDYRCVNIPGSFRCVRNSTTTTPQPEYEYEYYDSSEEEDDTKQNVTSSTTTTTTTSSLPPEPSPETTTEETSPSSSSESPSSAEPEPSPQTPEYPRREDAIRPPTESANRPDIDVYPTPNEPLEPPREYPRIDKYPNVERPTVVDRSNTGANNSPGEEEDKNDSRRPPIPEHPNTGGNNSPGEEIYSRPVEPSEPEPSQTSEQSKPPTINHNINNVISSTYDYDPKTTSTTTKDEEYEESNTIDGDAKTETDTSEVPSTPELKPVGTVYLKPGEETAVVRAEKGDDGSVMVDTGSIPKNTWTKIKEDPCQRGFELDEYGACLDIDECATSQHSCSGLTEVCRNTMGGYLCDCASAFRRDLVSGACVLISTSTSTTTEVPRTTATKATKKTPTFWGYPESPTRNLRPFRPRSMCDIGFNYNTRTGKCDDINECITGQANCAAEEVCVNSQGGYRCECQPNWSVDESRHRCVPPRSDHGLPPGYENMPVYQPFPPAPPRASTLVPESPARDHRCPWGYRLADDGSCEDVDECSSGEAQCGPEQVCTNLAGGYTCRCRAGHELAADHRCADVDECAAAGDVPLCSQNADCINTVGSYQCRCHQGFRPAPVNDKVCVDVDECAASGSKLCQQKCNNNWGGYRCTCHRGYRLNADNRTCSDIDECSEFKNKVICVGRCLNEPGSYRCSCPSGYRLSEDQKSCIDINECESGEAPCATGARYNGTSDVCLNTRGGYRCFTISCPPGYTLESKHRCTKIDRVCRPADYECAHQPTTYSYNYITFVSKLYIPASKVDLFTMRGPAWPHARMKFQLRLVRANAPPNVQKKADINSFLLVQTGNQAVMSLVESLEGPQSIELELSMDLYSGEQFGGTAVAKLFIYVSEYEF